MAYSSKRSQKPKNSIGRKKFGGVSRLFFFALPSSFLLAKTFWNSDQVTTQIGSTMMGSKRRKTKTNLTGLEQGYVVVEVVCGRRVVVSVWRW
jgi:hypothetical protein